MRKISSQTPSGTRSIVKGLLCSTAVAALIASAPAQANDMDEMRTELQNLLDRMESIEQTQVEQQVAAEIAAPLPFNRQYIRKRNPKMRSVFEQYDVRDLYIMPETARANGVVGGDLPGSFKIPGSDTSVSFSGALRMGVSYVGGSRGANFSTWNHAGLLSADGASTTSNALNMEAIQNNLVISTSSESSMGPVSSTLIIQSDRDGVVLQDTLSLNRFWAPIASIGVGNWTFGQQGFAFTSGNCYGETAAGGGAPCPLGIGPAIQYAGGGGGMNYRIQLVTPIATLDADGLADVAGSNVTGGLPDLQARLSSGMFSVGLQLRQYGYESKAGTPTGFNPGDTSVGWGIFPEVTVPMGKDKLYAGVAYTDGGRNTSINWSLWTGGRGDQGTIDPTTGSINNTETVSVHTYYTHAWSDTARSTLHASGGNSDVAEYTVGTDGTTPPLMKWRSVTGNIVWSLVPRVTTGVGLTYHSVMFRGDQGNTNATGNEANESIEGSWNVSITY